MNFCLYALLICSIGYQQLAVDATSRRWCCKSRKELDKCLAFSTMKADNGNNLFDFDCVEADGTLKCMEKILDTNEADIIDIDGGDMFDHMNRIKIVAAENNGGLETSSYYAVAVVRVGSDPTISLSNMDNVKTCHTGVGKTSGWNMPMGHFMRSGIDTTKFGDSCAPGGYIPKYRALLPDNNPAKWCGLCQGNRNGAHVCNRDHDEVYYGYDGAFRCLQEIGDVAFAKQSTVLDNIDDDDSIDNYELLCPDGTRKSPDQWDKCNLGRVPAHAVVVREGTNQDEITNIYNKIKTAIENIPEFNTYDGETNVLWSSSVESFSKVDGTVKDYLGHEYYCNTQAVRNHETDAEC